MKRKLKKLLKTKERVNEVLRLRKNGEFDKIFELYGYQVFNVAVTTKFKNKDIETLFDQGRFEDIYRRYGAKEYEKFISEMQPLDVYNETGSKFQMQLSKIKNTIKYKILPGLFTASLALGITAGESAVEVRKLKDEEAVKYEQELNEYNNNVEKYADEVKSMNLTDLQTVMKVMDDMWENIDGYGEPKIDSPYFPRLDMTEGGVGVCRNMADDVTSKLNAINPEYNARNLSVYLDSEELTSEGFSMANIERTILQDNETVVDQDNENQDQDGTDNSEGEKEDKNELTEEQKEKLSKYVGNHMVTAIDLKEEDVTLIIDSTNCNLGVFEDGKIYMFFNDTGNGMRATTLGNLLGFTGGENFGGIIQLTEDQIKSMLSSKISVAELAEKYGVEAQNRALKEVQRMEGKEKIDFVRMLSPEVFKQAQQSVRENETSRESYNIIQETSEVSGVQKNQKSAEQKVNGAQEINETPSAENTREETEDQDMER